VGPLHWCRASRRRPEQAPARRRQQPRPAAKGPALGPGRRGTAGSTRRLAGASPIARPGRLACRRRRRRLATGGRRRLLPAGRAAGRRQGAGESHPALKSSIRAQARCPAPCRARASRPGAEEAAPRACLRPPAPIHINHWRAAQKRYFVPQHPDALTSPAPAARPLAAATRPCRDPLRDALASGLAAPLRQPLSQHSLLHQPRAPASHALDHAGRCQPLGRQRVPLGAAPQRRAVRISLGSRPRLPERPRPVHRPGAQQHVARWQQRSLHRRHAAAAAADFWRRVSSNPSGRAPPPGARPDPPPGGFVPAPPIAPPSACSDGEEELLNSILYEEPADKKLQLYAVFGGGVMATAFVICWLCGKDPWGARRGKGVRCRAGPGRAGPAGRRPAACDAARPPAPPARQLTPPPPPPPPLCPPAPRRRRVAVAAQPAVCRRGRAVGGAAGGAARLELEPRRRQGVPHHRRHARRGARLALRLRLRLLRGGGDSGQPWPGRAPQQALVPRARSRPRPRPLLLPGGRRARAPLASRLVPLPRAPARAARREVCALAGWPQHAPPGGADGHGDPAAALPAAARGAGRHLRLLGPLQPGAPRCWGRRGGGGVGRCWRRLPCCWGRAARCPATCPAATAHHAHRATTHSQPSTTHHQPTAHRPQPPHLPPGS
jgi:hypothetical protein